MEGISEERRRRGEEIAQLRRAKKTGIAIEKCKEAIELFPDENFFYKILGDISYSQGNYKEAFESYLKYFVKIYKETIYLDNFFRFMEKLVENSKESLRNEIQSGLMKLLEDTTMPLIHRSRLIDYIYREIEVQDAEAMEHLQRLQEKRDDEFKKVLTDYDGKAFLFSLYFMVTREVERGTLQLKHAHYKVLLSSMEKNEFYQTAVYIAEKMLQDNNNDEVIIRTLFRLCRRRGDYEPVENYIRDHSDLPLKAGFNVQYELVYYFESKGDESSLRQVLRQMEQSASRSFPISKTLYNFYMRFRMFAEADKVKSHMEKLQKKRNPAQLQQKKGEDEALETDEEVWRVYRELASEQEHNRQLLATRELLKGFSHELGQPLTNIRYDISYYQMKKRKNLIREEDTEETLMNILRQTERIHHLLQRFVPIFSNKIEERDFSIVRQMHSVSEEMESRLNSCDIHFVIEGDDAITLRGDALKFHQILYNLIINSIHAIDEKRSGENMKDGEIRCQVNKEGDKIVVVFSDNGVGVPKELRRKVFEPFFTTKKKKKDWKKDEGGEGLGLYIVWNIAKMFGGKIRIDEQYEYGTRFILEFMSEGGETDAS